MKKLSKTETNQIERLWLTYFNDSLFAKGLITEDERNRMSLKINNYH